MNDACIVGVGLVVSDVVWLIGRVARRRDVPVVLVDGNDSDALLLGWPWFRGLVELIEQLGEVGRHLRHWKLVAVELNLGRL